MQLLERIHLVQFFLFEAQSLQLDPTSAIIAPNGAGKSALLDALQIVLLGGDRSRIRFNAQAGGSHRARTIRDYCLGVFRSGDEGRKRRTATTYISLVFRDQDSGQPLTWASPWGHRPTSRTTACTAFTCCPAWRWRWTSTWSTSTARNCRWPGTASAS
jgi:Chromosome segregation ATPases